MHIDEWLRLVGFNQHPFALKQADDEGDLLDQYFVPHPAYNAMLDAGTPRSSVLHAPRGAGKSSTRRMFEQQVCSAVAPHTLVVRLTDWMPVVERHGLEAPLSPVAHTDELLRQFVLAVSQAPLAPWLHGPSAPELQRHLAWICGHYDEYLLPRERAQLESRGWREDAADLGAYALDRLPPARRVRLLAELVRGMGFDRCYVLVDGVDELLGTAVNWAAGANLVEALLGNLALVEVPGLAFKLFLPSEVFQVLRERATLRVDRVQILALHWDAPLLQRLLSLRLKAFNDREISSLAQLAEIGLRDHIDGDLISAAQGSPRSLLELGDLLFQVRAETATSDDSVLKAAHLAAALARYELAMARGQPPAAPLVAADLVAAPTSRRGPPPLRIVPSGEIWFGEELFQEWPKLTVLQRRFLQYLYEHRDRLCTKDEIIAYVWAGRATPADDDSLRKLVDRVFEQLHEDPVSPRYFLRVPGHLRLINTAD